MDYWVLFRVEECYSSECHWSTFQPLCWSLSVYEIYSNCLCASLSFLYWEEYFFQVLDRSIPHDQTPIWYSISHYSFSSFWDVAALKVGAKIHRFLSEWLQPLSLSITVSNLSSPAWNNLDPAGAAVPTITKLSECHAVFRQRSPWWI